MCHAHLCLMVGKAVNALAGIAPGESAPQGDAMG